MGTILLALSFLLYSIALVIVFTIISALITLPENRLIPTNENGSPRLSILVSLKIWVWGKQDSFVHLLVRKESNLNKPAKTKYLIFFCISGMTLCMISVLWNYNSNEEPNKKVSKLKDRNQQDLANTYPTDSVILINQGDIKALEQLRKFTKTDSLKDSQIPKIW